MRKRKLNIGILLLLFYLCFFGIAVAVPQDFEEIGTVQCASIVNNIANDEIVSHSAYLDVGTDKEDFTSVVENKLKRDVAPIDTDSGDGENEMSKFNHHKEKPARGDENPTAPVPEPATMLLLGAGLAGIVAFKRPKIK